MTRHEAINTLRLYKRQCRFRNVVEAIDIATGDMAMRDAEIKFWEANINEEQSTEETPREESNTEQTETSEGTVSRLRESGEGSSPTSEEKAT